MEDLIEKVEIARILRKKSLNMGSLKYSKIEHSQILILDLKKVNFNKQNRDTSDFLAKERIPKERDIKNTIVDNWSEQKNKN